LCLRIPQVHRLGGDRTAGEVRPQMMQRLLLVLGLLATGCRVPPRAPDVGPEGYVFHPPPAPPPPKAEGPLTIAEAVRTATESTPAIRVARARAQAAAAGMDLVDTAYLPRVDLLWQEIRATRHNISGTTFPQGV